MVVLSPDIQLLRKARLERESKIKQLQLFIELSVTDVLQRQLLLKDVPKFINNVFNENKKEIKEALIERIEKASGEKWANIKGQDSFGMTRAMRIEKSFLNTKKIVINKSKNARRKQLDLISKILAGDARTLNAYGIKAGAELDGIEKITKSIQKNLQKSVKKTLVSSERRLIKSENSSIWYNKFIEKNGSKKVVWVLGDNPCPICAPLGGSVYSRAMDAPAIPVHPNCQCRLETI